MNSVNLIGRFTAKPELKSTPNGKSVCNFTLAVERGYKDSEGNAITDFIDFVAWNAQAEFICKWFDRGVRMGASGELQTRSYEKDGQPHKVTEVKVATVEFADGKREANAVSKPENTFAENKDNTFAESTNDDFTAVTADDDLPF
jgi:single-strand DNA-binding protein